MTGARGRDAVFQVGFVVARFKQRGLIAYNRGSEGGATRQSA